MLDNRPLPVLDERLSTAAALVPQGCVAADIGCDHGKLSVVIAKKCKKVIAVDSRESPLKTAAAQMLKSGADNVECRLGNGLSALKPGEADAIIIAGLSAKTICDILAAAPWVNKRGCRLILVPATKPHELRAWLYKNGFELSADIAALAAGRYYAVICAEYCGEPRSITPFESVVGKVSGPHREQYLKKEAAKLLKASQKYKEYEELAGLVIKEAEK